MVLDLKKVCRTETKIGIILCYRSGFLKYLPHSVGSDFFYVKNLKFLALEVCLDPDPVLEDRMHLVLAVPVPRCVPSSPVISSPFLHKTIFFSKIL